MYGQSSSGGKIKTTEEKKMNKKYIMTEEHKRKISEANKGKTGEIDTLTEKIRREKIKRTMKQKYLDDPLSFKRITECSLKKKEKLGYVNSPEARKKVSASLSKMWQDNKVTNKQKGTLFKKGYDPKRNVSKIFNEGHKSYAYKGMNKGLFALEKHPNWLGGKSFEPYGVEFNRVLKEKMRKKYSYRCQQCFRHQ